MLTLCSAALRRGQCFDLYACRPTGQQGCRAQASEGRGSLRRADGRCNRRACSSELEPGAHRPCDGWLWRVSLQCTHQQPPTVGRLQNVSPGDAGHTKGDSAA